MSEITEKLKKMDVWTDSNLAGVSLVLALYFLISS